MILSTLEVLKEINTILRTVPFKYYPDDGTIEAGPDLQFYNLAGQIIFWLNREEAKYRFLGTVDKLYHDYFTMTSIKTMDTHVERFESEWASSEEELFQKSCLHDIGSLTFDELTEFRELYDIGKTILDHYTKSTYIGSIESSWKF